MSSITLLRAAATLGLAVLLLTACGRDEPETVRFMAGFRAQANVPLVGVYAADAQGFFRDEGLAVEVLHAGGDGPSATQLLEAREIDVATATASGLIGLRSRRDRDGREFALTSIALFGQRGDRGWVTRADSGIGGPADFRGKRVGIKTEAPDPELRAILAVAGLTTADVEIVRVDFSVDSFVNGDVDVYPVFLSNEPDTIRRMGIAVNVIDPADFGVPTLGLVFMSHRTTIGERPEVLERFLRAVLRGIAWAEANPRQAIDLVLRYAPDADVDHQRFLFEIDLENARTPGGIGRAIPEQWQAVADLLLQHEAIPVAVDASAVFDGSLVEAVYASGGP
jgi:ABC-type nitrate/sulfonate/bicarbonate transport system substrate-binding protein